MTKSKPPKTPPPLAERMHAWRTAKGFSQTQAAIHAGVILRNWQNWEQAHRQNPRLDSIAPVLAVLTRDGF